MKLSMYILNDWLKKYEPIAYIEDGSLILRSVRIFADGPNMAPNKRIVYVGKASDFITLKGGDEVICVSGHDYIMLNSESIDNVLNDILHAFDYYADWEDQLDELILDGAPLQDLVDASQPIFDEPISVYDNSFISIAHSSTFKEGSLSKDWDSILKNGSHSMTSLLSFKDYFLKRQGLLHAEHAFFPNLTYKRGYWCNLNSNHKHYGTLFVIEVNHPSTEGSLQLCEMFGSKIEQWIRENQSHQVLPSEEEILSDILEETVRDPEYIERYYTLHGWETQAEKILIRITNEEHMSTINGAILKTLRLHFPEAQCVYFQDSCIVILVNLSKYQYNYIINKLTAYVKRSCSKAMVSRRFKEYSRILPSYEQCKSVESFIEKGPGIYRASDYTLQYFRKTLSNRIPEYMADPELNCLIQYDRNHRADLYKTLYVYLQQERNLVQTAEMLSIHRSTLIYRLGKIKELISCNLDLAEIREVLLYSYVLMGIPE